MEKYISETVNGVEYKLESMGEPYPKNYYHIVFKENGELKSFQMERDKEDEFKIAKNARVPQYVKDAEIDLADAIVKNENC